MKPILPTWALINGRLVAAGLSKTPPISLMPGLAGVCAIVTMGKKSRHNPISQAVNRRKNP
jgi:hypothetical protein